MCSLKIVEKPFIGFTVCSLKHVKKTIDFIMFSLPNADKPVVLPTVLSLKNVKTMVLLGVRSQMLKNHCVLCVFAQKR